MTAPVGSYGAGVYGAGTFDVDLVALTANATALAAQLDGHNRTGILLPANVQAVIVRLYHSTKPWSPGP